MMTRLRIAHWGLVAALLAAGGTPLRAEDGQKELDQATDLQLSADSLADLGKVADLCETAIKKGLSEDDTAFAKQLLSSALYRRAERIAAEIVQRQTPNVRWQQLRDTALADLQRLLKYDDQNVEAYLLSAQLQLLPEGDRKEARQAVDRAIALLADDKEKRSNALVLRARIASDPKQQLEDLGRAIEANPANTEAWELRAMLFVARGELDKAIDDFNKLLESDEENIVVRLAIAEALINLEKYDEAMKHVDKAIELDPRQAVSHALRARVHVSQEEPQKALSDLNEAVRLQPGNPTTLAMRAELRHDLEDLKGAKQDLNEALRIAPGFRQALALRSMISAEQGLMTDAIADIESLLKTEPQSVELRLQLGMYYSLDQRPRRAIEIFSQVIEDEPENWQALRARADTYLSVGKHAEAVEDYNVALKEKEDDSGILNNLAWVLATSPDDEVRDGARALELAKKACELTEYKRPHILSTLAGAYAETGDFESAQKWSAKALELAKEQGSEQLEQLQEEVESFKKGKPWRERQEVEEKPDPVKSTGVLET